jgi:hypothetical protein
MALNRWLAVLIAVAAVLFAISVSAEKSDTHSEPAVGHIESASPEGEAGESAQVAESGQSHDEGENETLLGVDLESTPLIVAAVIVSLALAGGAWARPDSRPLMALIGVAMLVFAVLDIREVVHQLDEDRTGLALLAALVALLHLAAAALAIRLAHRAGAVAAEA